MSETPEMPAPSAPPRRPGRPHAALAVTAAIVVVAVVAGVYGMAHLRGNPDAAACAEAVKTASRLAPLAHGEVAALAAARTPFRVPDVSFKDA